MRLFETRHGQVAPKDFYKGDASLPIGDTALTPLGKEQALLVAKRLKELNFNGAIFSSPYDRTMATASIIAEHLNLTIKPLACLHEIVSKVDENFKGATLGELKERYKRIDSSNELPPRWWGDDVEDLYSVIERVKNGLKSILEAYAGDVLLVGHAATTVAMRHLFGVEENLGFHWNCHLSLLKADGEKTYSNDSRHLPEEMRTGNKIIFTEQKEKFERGAEKALREVGGGKVLHIGDTSSSDYGYYKTLIERVKPSVIIHTGDLADELKAGRIEGVFEFWKRSAAEIVGIMENSGARVIIVPGNNDLEKDLKETVKKAEILERNSVIEIDGAKILLCHEINKMDETASANVFLYGHGLTGETRSAEDNEREGKLFFNATWGASLHDFKKGKHAIIAKAYL